MKTGRLRPTDQCSNQPITNQSFRSVGQGLTASRPSCGPLSSTDSVSPLVPVKCQMPTLQRALMRRSVDRKKTLPDPDSLKGVTPTKIINLFLRRVWTGQFRSKPCSHVHLARADIGPASEVCAECVALGDSWPALRMCLLCGYVGCCDKSKNKHAREHFRQTGHPLTRPYKERGMDWVWCYVDEALLDPR
jgi:hypothetical protein